MSVGFAADHVAEPRAEHPCRLARLRGRRGDLHRVVAEVGQRKSWSSRPPFACGLALIRAAPAGGKIQEPSDRSAIGVEQLVGPI